MEEYNVSRITPSSPPKPVPSNENITSTIIKEQEQEQEVIKEGFESIELSYKTTNIEKEHVHAVYDGIAEHWNHTRAKRKTLWPRIKCFLESLPTGSLVADIGCGDGKYLNANPNISIMGCDRSFKLIDICSRGESESETSNISNRKVNDIFCCDALQVPFRSNTFDAVICIAVMHHLSTKANRLRVLKELVRIVKINGEIEIQVWAREQEGTTRRKFEAPDVMVPWKLQMKYVDKELTPSHAEYDEKQKLMVYQRYCHVYAEGELEELCTLCGDDIEIIAKGNDFSNWWIRLKRLK